MSIKMPRQPFSVILQRRRTARVEKLCIACDKVNPTFNCNTYQCLSHRPQTTQELLLGSDLALAKIAFACGFADQGHFSRVFVAWVGVPPGTWRRSRSA
ncbi:helix-turn-helix domain-containing protein [Rhizobium sp. 2YAF20]|uniref:helix-turn-helix domain-containing protein n=1 Tax=Rhizobium sp. 2YAF20 TaxID=3233027 RepID=UPI003F9BC08A